MCTPPCRQITQRTCRLRAAPTAFADRQYPNCKPSQQFTARILLHPGRYPGTCQSSTVPSRRCVLIRTRQPTKIEGRSGPGVPTVGGLVCSRLSVAIALQARKGNSMCTVTAAAVEPAGEEKVSGPAGLKPGLARALLQRGLDCSVDRPEKVTCQPGFLTTACVEKQRRRSGVACSHNGMARFETGMFKGRGR